MLCSTGASQGEKLTLSSVDFECHSRRVFSVFWDPERQHHRSHAFLESLGCKEELRLCSRGSQLLWETWVVKEISRSSHWRSYCGISGVLEQLQSLRDQLHTIPTILPTEKHSPYPVTTQSLEGSIQLQYLSEVFWVEELED